MEIMKSEEIVHLPHQKEDYPYALSAKIFHTKQLFLYKELVPPGKRSSAPHFHQAIDEIIFVINGELVAVEGNEEALIKSGDSICFFARSGKLHYLENRSERAASFLLFRRAIEKDDVLFRGDLESDFKNR